jgi:DNA-directed RNA polymerase subunit RPC12/RpoP
LKLSLPGAFFITLHEFMNFIHIDTYVNYIDANIVLGRLESEGINCWLRDENTVTIDPILTNAVGGIKLMVAAPQAERAIELLQAYRQEKKKMIRCLNCGSDNIELVTTPRKASNWFWALFGFFLGDYALQGDKVYHCFNCNKEFSQKEMDETLNKNDTNEPVGEADE